MPKSKQKTSKGQEAASSSPGKPPLSQQQSQSFTQAEKAISSFNKEDVESRVNDLVQFLLIMDQKKIPIKKQEINKHVIREFKSASPIIIQKAREKLMHVFGIELVELEDKMKGSFVLINLLDTDCESPHLVWSGEDNRKTGLLITILSLIFMNGNVISDGELWHTLKIFGIDPEANHNVFGDVKKLITTEFVRQGYLEFIRQANSDPPSSEVKWGQRAKQEISKRNVLDFVSQIYDMKPEEWTSQWQDVVQTESSQAS